MVKATPARPSRQHSNLQNGQQLGKSAATSACFDTSATTAAFSADNSATVFFSCFSIVVQYSNLKLMSLYKLAIAKPILWPAPVTIATLDTWPSWYQWLGFSKTNPIRTASGSWQLALMGLRLSDKTMPTVYSFLWKKVSNFLACYFLKSLFIWYFYLVISEWKRGIE